MTKQKELAQYIKSELANEDPEIYLDINDYEIIVKALEQDEELDFVQEHKKIPVPLQVQKYCDRNICVSNEYNGIGCDECEVTKSQEPKTDYVVHGTDGNIYKLTISNGKEFEQETCDDAVNRADVRHLIAEVKRKSLYSISSKAFEKLYNGIDDLPPVNPQPKIGHWINIEDRTDWYDAAYNCSCCGRAIITPYELKNNLYSDYPYCHCGARMIEPPESEEV